MAPSDSVPKRTPRKAWQTPVIRKAGTVADILQGGGGKLSIAADDGGDSPRKPAGQG